MKRSNSIRDRRGVFLIEVVAVIVLSVVILSIGVALLQLTLKLERGRRAELVATTTLNRLSRDFRSDVHAAENIEIQGDNTNEERPARLELLAENEQVVRYEMSQDSLMRTQLRAGEPVRREVYRLPSGSHVLFRLESVDSREMAMLDVQRPASNDSKGMAEPLTFSITGVLARDHRFTQARSGEEMP